MAWTPRRTLATSPGGLLIVDPLLVFVEVWTAVSVEAGGDAQRHPDLGFEDLPTAALTVRGTLTFWTKLTNLTDNLMPAAPA